MPASYQPAEDAKPVPPWSIAMLSERDLSLRAPIDLVTVPGVSLRQVCFGHDVFDNDATVTCFSNLLAAGFRRFEWDLFWDSNRRVWSFCPIQIPQSKPSIVASSTQMMFNSSTIIVSDAVLTARAPTLLTTRDAKTTKLDLLERQVPGTAVTSGEPDTGSTASLNPTLGGSEATAATTSTAPAPSTTPEDLVQVGPYSCSRSIDLPILAAVLAEYFESTSNTLDAFLTYLTLNLHVAASSASSAPGFLNSTMLPGSQEVISALLGMNLTSYLYTPTLLARERSNVNASWFAAASDAQPLVGYYNLTHYKGASSSENGWPNEIYLEFERQRRLLVQFGQIDSQLSSYNLSADDDVIFPSRYLQDELTDIRLSANGEVESGCFYNQANLTVGGNNNSWAAFTLTQFPAEQQQDFFSGRVREVENLTACGISSFLNTTLFNRTADQNVSDYNHFIRSTTWAWAYGEPRNVSSEEENASRVRCAAMDRSLNGRWRVVDCTDRHYAACRVNNKPFTWRISSTKATYTSSNDICDDGQTFSVPFTALENRHLFREVQQEMSDDHLLWVNFNSLNYGNCFVVGVNQTCPYRERKAGGSGRTVVVPTVAAVIVFVVTALTLFVKCAANRQTTRRGRRRRFDQGWEYEGVPS